MDNINETRLYLGGVPVDFVKWTGRGLIYTRVGSQETMAHLSRSTVLRLIEEGTLEVEGYSPEWVHNCIQAD